MKSFAASTAFAFLGLSGFTRAAYTLTESYDASNWFSKFNFFTGNDPTHGYVNYVDQATAQNSGLINTNNGQIYMGVDHTTYNPGGRGRNSVRLESKRHYTTGLFILDMNHMPGSVCGSWPAFWTYGTNWPNNGEIDIIEGVNSQAKNFVTLHTGQTCKIGAGAYSGQLATTNCNVNEVGGEGCSIHSTNTQSYGDGFNSNGGGVYAMEWTTSTIKVWYFGRNNGAIPGDIYSGNPNPNNWGTPLSSMPGNGGCNVQSAFADHFVIFDTTFCGDWAGQVFSSDPQCSNKGSCQSWVANNPNAFAPSYWSINNLKVYTRSAGAKRDEEGVAQPMDIAEDAAIVARAANETVTAESLQGMSPNGLPGFFTEEFRLASLVPGVDLLKKETSAHAHAHAARHGVKRSF